MNKLSLGWSERNNLGRFGTFFQIFIHNPSSPKIVFKISEANPRLAREQCKTLRPG